MNKFIIFPILPKAVNVQFITGFCGTEKTVVLCSLADLHKDIKRIYVQYHQLCEVSGWQYNKIYKETDNLNCAHFSVLFKII